MYGFGDAEEPFQETVDVVEVWHTEESSSLTISTLGMPPHFAFKRHLLCPCRMRW